jgi:hypothetical protein
MAVIAASAPNIIPRRAFANFILRLLQLIIRPGLRSL